MSVVTKEVALGQALPMGIRKGQAMAMCQHFGRDQRNDQILEVKEVPGLPADVTVIEWAALCQSCIALYRVVQ